MSWCMRGPDGLPLIPRYAFVCAFGLYFVTVMLWSSSLPGLFHKQRRNRDTVLVAMNQRCRIWVHVLVTRENHCQIALLATKIVIHTNTDIISVLTRYLCLQQERFFLTRHFDVITLDLWRQENAGYWYCDVIFVDCSFTGKLAESLSSLVNNKREYRLSITSFSWLTV